MSLESPLQRVSKFVLNDHNEIPNKQGGYTPIHCYNIVYGVIVDCQDQDFYVIVIVL